jgi:hypothetical protein
MSPTIEPLKPCHEFLRRHGIKSTFLRHDYLAIDRTSMVQTKATEGLLENDAYDFVFALIEEEFPQYHVMWSGRTDDYLGVEFYTKKGKILNKFIASELLKVAQSLLAIEFPTDEAMKKYLREHPDADKRNHRVVKTKPQQTHKQESTKTSIKPAKQWDKFLSDRYGDYLEIGAKHKKMVPAKYKEVLDTSVKKYVSSTSIYHRTTTKGLLGILKDQRFKTQIETHTSGALENQEARRVIEKNLFSTPDNEKPAERPIYGYLSKKKGDEAGQYGGIVIKLKDSLRRRTTCTFGDSLDTAAFKNAKNPSKGLLSISCLPQQLDEADSRCIPIYQLAETKTQKDVESGKGTSLGMSGKGSKSYFEAQIHGGVTLNDIEEVRFANKNSRTPELEAMLKKAGIKYN